jgi:hypothetical protein
MMKQAKTGVDGPRAMVSTYLIGKVLTVERDQFCLVDLGVH